MADQTQRKGTGLSIGERLAFDRTNFAHDRTMMAWVRTATALITFGFAVFKFFQLELGKRPPIQQVIGPREFAIMMIAIGVFALFVATFQHVQYTRRMREQYAELPRSLAALVAGLVSILGVVALVAVVLRL
jgi:putative membrane protein